MKPIPPHLRSKALDDTSRPLTPKAVALRQSWRRWAARGILAATIPWVAAAPLSAQMVSGTVAIGGAPALGLDRDHRTHDFSVKEIECSAPSNVLWPGERLSFKFLVTNETSAPLTAEGTFKTIHYGTRGLPGDIWVPQFFQIAGVGSIPFKLDLAPHASTEVAVAPDIPETFGGYVVVAELAGHGQAFAASVVRVISPDGGAVRIPAYALDFDGTSEEVVGLFKRLGIKGARLGLSAFSAEDRDADKKWAEIDRQVRTLRENEVTAMVTTGGNSLPMPLGVPRPHLTDDGTFMDTKSDTAWLPAGDGEFEQWIKKLCGTYGWPKGPINAMELWNEPWEGISISGWGADMPRYREIYSAMARGVVAARAEDKTDVLIGGCGSSSNTLDKLFPDGSDTFLKWLDFCSIHYQSMAATPALMRNFVNRKSPEGPVRVWDTESWIANTDDRIGVVVASMHAMGQERAMGTFRGNVYEMTKVKLADGKEKTVVQSWSAAAAVAASTKFVGQRKFRDLLFQNGLPWIFVFDGRPGQTEDDGTVVVTGDLGGSYSRERLLFRSVYGLKNQAQVQALQGQLAALAADASEAQRKALQAQLDAASVLEGGSLTISDGGGQFYLTDFYGNRVAAKAGKIVVPLDGYGYYLRTNGQPGSFARLLADLRGGRVEGYEPVEIVAHDLTSPLGAGPSLRLTMTNVLNRSVAGKLAVRLGGVELTGTPGEIRLAANETRDIEVKVAGLPAVPGNTYALHAEFDAGSDGRTFHDETLHANVVVKRTITVDGKLDDWAGVPPQTLVSKGIGANLTEKAWLPFNKFDDSEAPGLTTGYAAYDDDNFYFAARISDSTPDAGMLRFETRDDDAFFYPELSYRIDKSQTFAKQDKVFEAATLGDRLLQLPQGGERSKTDWESVSTSLAFNVSLPPAELHQAAFYLLSWDPSERHNVNVTIKDAASGKVLHRQTVKNFGDGKYLVYNLAGNLRVEISSNSFLKAVLDGCFFDQPKNPGTTHEGAAAQFVGVDEKTRGDWQGVYGADGYAIAGGPAKLPAYGHLEFSTEISKQDLRWPEGVRRFSYRTGPALPAGGPTSHDNVQIAFNVLPADQKPWLPNPPGVPPHWMVYWDTDYEYAFNEVAAAYGGGTEIWRLQTPGMPRKSFYPRQLKSPFDGAVKNGKLVMRRDGNTRIVEAALPWSEIPEVRKRLDAGQTIKFDFRVNDNGGPSYELAADRSVSKHNGSAFHNDWQTHWANELEFGFQK